MTRSRASESGRQRALLLQEGRGALDIGERKGDGAGRQVGHSYSTSGVLACAGALYEGALSQRRDAGRHWAHQPHARDGLRHFLNFGGRHARSHITGRSTYSLAFSPSARLHLLTCVDMAYFIANRCHTPT